MAYQAETVRFQSHGNEIVGILFIPEGASEQEKRPAITTIGPVGFVKEQAPLQYATRLAKEGFITLIFDPRYHGESSGEPRRLESGDAKVQDIRASIDFLEADPRIHAAQIFGLGICQGVNWMIEAAVGDERLRAIAIVAGHYLLPEVAERYLGSRDAVDKRVEQARAAQKKYVETGEVDYIPIVGEDAPHAHLLAQPVYQWYIRWEDSGPWFAHRGRWENRLAGMSEALIWNHEIDKVARHLTTPTLMIHADRAASGPDIPHKIFGLIPAENKELLWLGKEVQIQFYEDPITIDKCVEQIQQWFYRLQKHDA